MIHKVAPLGLAFALAGAAAPAFAQDRALLVRPDLGGYGYGPGTRVDALPTPFSHGGSCVKKCPTDTTPCDPDYWKLADRRCNLNEGSRGLTGGPLPQDEW